MYTEEELKDGFTIGEWRVVPTRCCVERDGETFPVPRLEWQLLMMLSCYDGDIVSNDVLVEKIWDNRAIGDGPVTRCVTSLRRILGDNARPYQYVGNQPRQGYRMVAEVVPDRISEPEPVPDTVEPHVPPARPRSSWTQLLAGAALLVAAVLIVREIIDSPPPPVETLANSVGVLPFDNLSGAEQDQYLVNGFKQELLHSLAALDDLKVVNIRSGGVADLSRQNGVENILQGSVLRDGDSLVFRVTLTRVEDGMVLITASREGEVAEHFELQQAVAGDLSSKLRPDQVVERVTARTPTSFAAYDEYMQGLYKFQIRGPEGVLEEAIEHFENTVELDPDFGPAYLMLATSHTLMPTYSDTSLIDAEALALDAVERGLLVDDNLDTSMAAVRGYFHHMRKEWSQSEAQYRLATEAAAVDATAFLWFSRMLASVGRLDDSLQAALQGYRLDPTSATINSRVAMAYTWLGDQENAAEFYQRAGSLGASASTHALAYSLFLFQADRIDEAEKLTRLSGTGDSWITPVFAALADPGLVPDALSAVSASVEAGSLPPNAELVIRTLLRDIEGAMKVVQQLRDYGEPFEMDLLFIPMMRELRAHPDFESLMTDLNLRAYWQANDCGWAGHSFSCGQGQ